MRNRPTSDFCLLFSNWPSTKPRKPERQALYIICKIRLVYLVPTKGAVAFIKRSKDTEKAKAHRLESSMNHRGRLKPNTAEAEAE